jgi:ribokinase
LIGRVGSDAFGRELRAYLAAQGVDLALVQDTPEAHTGTALITLANAANTIVVVPGANGFVSPADVGTAALTKADVAVSQFEIPLPVVSAFFRRARSAGAITILNPAPAVPFDQALFDLVDILVLNESELGLLANAELCDTDDHTRFVAAVQCLPIKSDKIVCVTLGSRGAVALIEGEPLIIAGRAVTAVDTTGAGDCFVGALATQPPATPSVMPCNMPTSPPRFACSASARRLRCRWLKKWKVSSPAKAGDPVNTDLRL